MANAFARVQPLDAFSLVLSLLRSSVYLFFEREKENNMDREERKKGILFHRCRSCRGRPTIVLCPVKSMFNRAVSNIQIFKRSERERENISIQLIE